MKSYNGMNFNGQKFKEKYTTRTENILQASENPGRSPATAVTA